MLRSWCPTSESSHLNCTSLSDPWKATLIITLETQWNLMKAEVKQQLFLPQRFYKTIQINHLEKPSIVIILRVLQALQRNNDEWIHTSTSVTQPSSKKRGFQLIFVFLLLTQQQVEISLFPFPFLHLLQPSCVTEMSHPKCQEHKTCNTRTPTWCAVTFMVKKSSSQPHQY